LLDDLRRGRWAIDRAVYDANVGEAVHWLDVADEPLRLTWGEILATVVDDLRSRDRTDGQALVPGRRLHQVDGAAVAVVAVRATDGLAALVAGSELVEREFLASIRPAIALQRSRVDLRDPNSARGPDEVRRSPAETGLPWSIVARNDDLPADLQRLSTRRTLWLVGLATLTMVLVVAGGVTIRGVVREMAAARLQSDFVAAVSHEFRTPLTTLRQLTEVLSESRLVNESRRQTYYDALGRQTDRLQRLVERLLDFGRMEAGERPYACAPHDLAAVVRDVVETFQAEVRSSSLVRLTAADPAPVSIDRDAIGLALWNLLDNAVKYSPDGGAIDVEVRRDRADAVVEVRDRGIGIPRHELPTLFERFRRGAEARSRGIKGTGLGLALVHHVIAAHRGRIDVASDVGAGTTFTVHLPLETEAS
jgi:signal transduction histidine kinase